MSSCKHLLAKAILEALTEECINKVPVGDETRVDEIALRKYAGTARLVLIVQHFHPIKELAWADAIVAASSTQSTDGFRNWPTMDSSGGANSRIRGSVMLSGNLVSTGEDTTKADEIIQEVAARVEWTLWKYRDTFIGIPKDSYGRKIVEFQAVAASEYDSGADTSNTSKIWIEFVAMTHRERSTT